MRPEGWRACLAVVVVLAVGSSAAWAGALSGTVTVIGKDGKPISRSDHAVVYVQGIETPAPVAPAVLDQLGKEFVPRLLPVVKGQEVRFPNQDPVQHNVFSPHEQEPFDLGLYPHGESRSVRLNVLGRHKVYCNLHKSMVADILVLPNRFFGLTDAQGRYRIPGRLAPQSPGRAPGGPRHRRPLGGVRSVRAPCTGNSGCSASCGGTGTSRPRRSPRPCWTTCGRSRARSSSRTTQLWSS